jgi:hypothetical protein
MARAEGTLYQIRIALGARGYADAIRFGGAQSGIGSSKWRS